METKNITKEEKMALIEQLKKLDSEELSDVLYHAFYDEEDNVVDLSYLDFWDYSCSVDIRCMKVDGTLYQPNQYCSGIIYQHEHVCDDVYEGDHLPYTSEL